MAMAGWLLRRAAELRRDFTWREAGGSLGDLGTFIPLLVGLTAECGLDVGTTLVFTGLYNLATALAFDVPMPLQPMKTIAAVAMTDPPMDVPQIVAAGGFVALVVLVLGCTGLMERFNAVTPFGVVRGMQLGLGMLLCAKGWTLAVWTDGTGQSMRGLWGPDGMALGALALAFVLASAAPTKTTAAGSAYFRTTRSVSQTHPLAYPAPSGRGSSTWETCPASISTTAACTTSPTRSCACSTPPASVPTLTPLMTSGCQIWLSTW